MLLRREGMPDEDDFVICTVTGVQPHCVFARLDEYDKSGLIHISEIAPGRIRNIREYVQEGKKIVCKVLRIDMERGHIDLSLRRVNEGQRREKLSELKEEQLAEKIVEHAAHKLKQPVEEVYNKITDSIFKKYPLLFSAFKDVADGKLSLASLGIDKTLAEELESDIIARLQPEEVSVKGTFSLHSTAGNGINIIKKILTDAQALREDADIRYLGNGLHHLVIKGTDIKDAEKAMSLVSEAVLAASKKAKVQADFQREE